MFKYVSETMPSHDKFYYKNVVLPNVFRDFTELRYGYDPKFEEIVLFDLIYNLVAYSICQLDDYAATVWKNAYGGSVFDSQPGSLLSSDYALQLETMFRIFDSTGAGEFEMIRMAVCYIKAKRINLKNVFPRYDYIVSIE